MHKLISLIKEHKKLSASVLLFADIIFFTLTNPNNSSPFVMAFGFLLVLGSIYALSRAVFNILRFLGYVKETRKWVKEAITGLIFLLIIMQSVGQLSMMDALALIPVSIVGYFYYSFISEQKHSD